MLVVQRAFLVTFARFTGEFLYEHSLYGLTV